MWYLGGGEKHGILKEGEELVASREERNIWIPRWGEEHVLPRVGEEHDILRGGEEHVTPTGGEVCDTLGRRRTCGT
jgi:hypothetical protein